MGHMSVVLIGMMGVGKTTMGRLAAKALGYKFIDLDRAIEERAGKRVDAIFAEDGEATFRQMEADTADSLAGAPRVIVSAGGGAPMREGNMARLRAIGVTVYLKASEAMLLQRLEASKKPRPLLQGEGWKEQLTSLLERREPIYMSADFVLEVDHLSRLEIADAIKQIALGAAK